MFRPLPDRPGTVSACPECNQPFRPADSPHAPLILNCGHLCGEECIRTALNTEGIIMCKECNTISTMKTSPDGKHNLRVSFPLSEKMVEEIHKQTQMKPVDESCIGFKSSKRRSTEKLSPNTSLHYDACAECHTILAVLKCRDCKGALFCESCWHQVHSHKTTQNHSFDIISLKTFNPLEKKPEYTKLLNENREKLLKKQEKLERSIKIINNPEMINDAKSSCIELNSVGDDLKSFFMYCKNIIQSLESKIMREYEAVACSLDLTHNKCYKELDHTRIEIVDLVRQMYELSRNDFYDSSEVETLLRKSRELLEKPDTVRTKRVVSGSKKITMPSREWIENLETQLNFDFGKPGEFYLVRGPPDTDELDYRESELLVSVPCSNYIDDSFENVSHSSLSLCEKAGFKPNERRSSKTNSVQFPLNSNPEYFSGDHRCARSISDMEFRNRTKHTPSIHQLYPSPIQISGPSFSCLRMGPQQSRTSYDPKIARLRSSFGRQVRFKEGWRGTVVISCITTPSYFYVQLESGLIQLGKYRKFFAHAVKFPAVDKEEIKTGNMYLAQCSDGEWYRVRFSQIIPKDQTVSVNQIDTGKTEMVDISKLRRIDDVMKSAAMDPELAIECCIFDCYPIGLSWNDSDNETFARILKDKSNITMIVKKVHPNKLEVDLTWNDNGCEGSIRDYMLMSKTACLASKKDTPCIISTTENLKYFKDTDFHLKEWIDIKVTFVFGPQEVYVKRIDSISEKKIKDMNAQIDAFYKISQNNKYYKISNLVEGLPVAALFTGDKHWYRAEILSINQQSKKVEVRYVDFGNKEHLPFNMIRQLAKEFIRFTVQTVKCSLTGIKPINGTEYKSQATNFFIKNVEEKVLKLVVEGKKGDELFVILFRSDEDEDVCLNLLLVEEGFAKRAGNVLGMVASYPKREGIRNSKPKIATTVVEKPISVNEPKEVEVWINNVESSIEVEDSVSKISSTEEITPEDNDVSDFTEKRKYEVTMVDFISPNKFYVKLSANINLIQQINQEMCKFYRDEKNNKELLIESVEKDSKCVAYSEKQKKWNRAKVLEVEENGQVLVFYIDFGFEETVKLEDLRKLDEKFNKLCDGVIICHLHEIESRPNWPDNFCNSLRTYLSAYTSLLIRKMPKEPGKRTLPVLLWGKEISCRGAFDPYTEELSNVNEFLANVLERDDFVELDLCNFSVQNPVEEIGEISSSESVQKWLHSSVTEATENGIEFSEVVANGEIPPERLFSSKSTTKSTSTHKKSTPVKSNFVEEDGRELREIPMQDWKPPEPIDTEEFDVFVTHVNEDFYIFVQRVPKQLKIIEMISKGLQSRFENTTPLPMDLHWYPGQICVASFYMDKQWYRGRILKVEDKKAVVEYVDFGNTELVDIVNLRKDVVLEQYPIQCYKLPIRSDIVPLSEDGKWQSRMLDLVHFTIIEKKCRIKLRMEEGENFYRIEKLFIDDTEKELFDFLCQLSHVTYSHSSDKYKGKKQAISFSNTIVDSDNVKDNENDDNSKSDSSSSIAVVDSASNLDLSEILQIPGVSNVMSDPFSIPQNPQNNEIIVPFCEVPVSELNIVTVQVIEVLQMDEIVVHIVDCDNETMDLNRRNFLKMVDELQLKGDEQPLLESPSLGRMCCTKFDDGMWYRAKIIDCSDHEIVTILYVDYGNSCSVHSRELREMKRPWFDVPIQSIRCQLIDFEIQDSMEEMLKLINDKFEAVLESSDDPRCYKIKLYF